MSVLTWQTVYGVANLLPVDLRVTSPANLDMAHIVYEAPQNSHRSDVPAGRAHPLDPAHQMMGLASATVPTVPPDGDSR